MALLDLGAPVLIDDEDLPLVDGLSLRVRVIGSAINPLSYVEFKHAKKTWQLHRWLMNPPRGVVVDHINGDGLDNRRTNLRVCTHAENMRNRRMHSNNKSGFKGVYFDKRRQLYRASIRAFNQKFELGMFVTAEEAAHAYSVAAAKYHGEFAKA